MFYMLMHLYVLYHKNKNPHRSSFSCLTNLPISQGVGLRRSQSSNGARGTPLAGLRPDFEKPRVYPM